MKDFKALFNAYPKVENEDDILQNIKTIAKEMYETNDNLANRKFLFSCLELTSLQPTDNEINISQLVEKINRMDEDLPELPKPAGICVYPSLVETAKNMLTEDLAISTVIGFPSSQTYTAVKVAEAALAVSDGATEIDMVLPVGKFLQECYEDIYDEINEIKSSAQEAKLKVILETGLLGSAQNIQNAAILALEAGADFIKTTTGKEKPTEATAVYTMAKALKAFNNQSGANRGIKLAGGIKTSQDALLYLCIVKDLLGEDWPTADNFRIGASQLANTLISEINKETKKYF